MTDTPGLTPQSDALRSAAVLIRERAAAAPDGPYTLGFRDTDNPEYRVLFAGDGDPMGAVRYWPGGLGRDTGEEEQTGKYFELWTPAFANTIADWLERMSRIARETEVMLGDQFQDGAYPHEVHEALAAARAVVGEA